MKYIYLIIGLIFLGSCTEKQEATLTNAADYDDFLAFEKLEKSNKYFELWNGKIKPDSLQLTSLGIAASHYSALFNTTGEIAYVKKAEAALERAVSIANIGKSNYLRALARNYITQHRFREAFPLAKEAEAMGSGLSESWSLLFDIQMELGDYDQAYSYLNRIKNMSDFGYLIRVAKWNDYKGDLNTTIRFMEKALKRAEASKNKDLMIWTYSNLADYYGHDGRIEESYRYFLKTLALDANNAYAKKGIAWIVFSHERNPDEALRILNSITQYHHAPDYDLLKAEIAAFKGDQKEESSHHNNYLKAVENPDYGEMYTSYTSALLATTTKTTAEAVQLARQEVLNRATPETYSLLAFCYYKNNEKEKAIEIIEDKVIGKTFEPGIHLQVAQILKANGTLDQVTPLKKDLKEAIYELGPNAEKDIISL